jgi:hypothetical protein
MPQFRQKRCLSQKRHWHTIIFSSIGELEVHDTKQNRIACSELLAAEKLSFRAALDEFFMD